MTRITFEGCRGVDNNGVSINYFHVVVTSDTPYALVSTLQRELGSFVMIESRRLPPLIDVAAGAGRFVIVCFELAGMRILVTGFTGLRGAFELDLRSAGKRF